MAANQDVIHAYRHLYRAALRAVCYSQPSSTVARDQLRAAFRARDARFDARATKRTIWFLKNAARENGIEHKIVKNMLLVKWWKDFVRKQDRPTWKQIVDGTASKKSTGISETAYVHYGKTIEMLNKTMDTCLPLP